MQFSSSMIHCAAAAQYQYENICRAEMNFKYLVDGCKCSRKVAQEPNGTGTLFQYALFPQFDSTPCAFLGPQRDRSQLYVYFKSTSLIWMFLLLPSLGERGWGEVGPTRSQEQPRDGVVSGIIYSTTAMGIS
ncbi:hypothetical protein CBL_01982 [Carabus blaptoides fortunei]